MNLKRVLCLKSLLGVADEVLVVDSYSGVDDAEEEIGELTTSVLVQEFERDSLVLE